MDMVQALESEIEFWEEVLHCQDDDAPPETIERIELARLLAERKLGMLVERRGHSLN